MKKYNELNELEKEGLNMRLIKDGWNITTYYPENEKGYAKNGIGFMAKDLIIRFLSSLRYFIVYFCEN